jgi:hypothetical protein
MRASNVRHIVGKLLMRATTLLQISLQLEVCTPRFLPPKSWESQLWEFPSCGTWESWDKKPFECGSCGELQSILSGGKWWLHPSSGRGESCEFELLMARPSTKSVPTMH